MTDNAHRQVTAEFIIQTTWVPDGTVNPLSWRSAREFRSRQDKQRREAELVRNAMEEGGSRVWKIDAAFSAAFGPRVLPCPSAEPLGTWPGRYSPQDMIAMAMGALEPRWMNGYWWHERERYTLADIESVEDIARLQLPDWGALDVVRRMLASRRRWRAAPEPRGNTPARSSSRTGSGCARRPGRACVTSSGLRPPPPPAGAGAGPRTGDAGRCGSRSGSGDAAGVRPAGPHRGAPCAGPDAA